MEGKGGRAGGQRVDTSQEALEPIGRILDLEAFPRFGKPESPSFVQGE